MPQVAQYTLEGIAMALERKKEDWTMATNMAEFRLQVQGGSQNLPPFFICVYLLSIGVRKGFGI